MSKSCPVSPHSNLGGFDFTMAPFGGGDAGLFSNLNAKDIDPELFSVFLKASGGDDSFHPKTNVTLPTFGSPNNLQHGQPTFMSDFSNPQNIQTNNFNSNQNVPEFLRANPMAANVLLNVQQQRADLNTFHDSDMRGDHDDDDSEDDASHPSGKGGDLKSKLARKAELARHSRRRRKLYVQDLEDKVKRLGAKIEELQQKQAKDDYERAVSVSYVSDVEKKNKELADSLKIKLFSLMNNANIDSVSKDQENEILKSVQEIIINSRDRQLQAMRFLDQASDYISPLIQTKFVLWGLDQGDEFYEGQGLWSALLFKELGLNPDQVEKLKERRGTIHQERQNMAAAEKMMNQLRLHVHSTIGSMHREMNSIISLLTPIQLAKFFIWIEQNQWCMTMLNSISASSQPSTK